MLAASKYPSLLSLSWWQFVNVVVVIIIIIIHIKCKKIRIFWALCTNYCKVHRTHHQIHIFTSIHAHTKKQCKLFSRFNVQNACCLCLALKRRPNEHARETDREREWQSGANKCTVLQQSVCVVRWSCTTKVVFLNDFTATKTHEREATIQKAHIWKYIYFIKYVQKCMH